MLEDQPESQAIESSFNDLGRNKARKLPNGRVNWDGYIMPLALHLIASRRSHRYAARALKVAPQDLFERLNSDRWSAHYARSMVERAANVAELAMETVERSDLDPNDKRVRVDTYKWFAARMDPKRWGDRIPMPDADQEQARAMAALGTDAARLALTGIVAALGMTLQPATMADSTPIEGESRKL